MRSWLGILVLVGCSSQPPLYSVSASSAKDVWAVGGQEHGAVFHDDGHGWNDVVLDGDHPVFQAVLANAPDDVWVGGASFVHFDGSRWTEFPRTGYGYSQRLWAAGADVYSIGFYDDDGFLGLGSERHVFTLSRFQAGAWQELGIDGLTGEDETEAPGAWASGADDVWVAASHDDKSTTLAHFDGTSWTTTKLALGGDNAIWGFARDDVWMHSAKDDSLWHFDGQSWARDPDITNAGCASFSVSAWSPQDVWALGSDDTVCHFDGTWHRLADRVPARAMLISVTAVDDGRAVAVGYEGNDGLLVELTP